MMISLFDQKSTEQPPAPLKISVCEHFPLIFFRLIYLQTEIAKRLNALIGQLLPFLATEHQQQVAQAVERAKQVTMPELNAIIGVRIVKEENFNLFSWFWLFFCKKFFLISNQLKLVEILFARGFIIQNIARFTQWEFFKHFFQFMLSLC